MTRSRTTRRILCLLLTLGILAPAAPAGAQPSGSVQPAAPEPPSDPRTTRESFREVLLQYGPALGRILRSDPTLMTNAEYLATYPAAAAFIQAHPEVVRDPGYFLATFEQYGSSDDLLTPEQRNQIEAVRMWRNTMEGFIFFLVFVTITLTLVWLIRYIIGHRRWLRATRVQSEVHGRLLERFSSNEELMAYIQSPAGSSFLKSSPIVIDDPSAATVPAPITRILWSVQAGLVLASAGVGLLIIRNYIFEEVGDLMLTMGGLALSLGAGFALAAGASYVISNRLGLFEAGRTARSTDGAV